MDKITWETPLLGLVPQLRRLQYAANMLNYHEFCEASGWPEDAYSQDKWADMQRIGKLLPRFDNHVLEAMVRYYEEHSGVSR